MVSNEVNIMKFLKMYLNYQKKKKKKKKKEEVDVTELLSSTRKSLQELTSSLDKLNGLLKKIK
jgi:uncharacterized protein YlxW (UPF0749 family)